MSSQKPGRGASPEPLCIRHTFTMRSGLRLVADAWGDSRARAVVLLHGGGQTRHAWKNTARALAAENWYALAVDLRGHGESDWAPDGNYSLTAFVDDFCFIRQSLSHPPAIVGASLGGLIGMLAAGERGVDAAASLVLVDVAPRNETAGIDRIVNFMRAYPQGFVSLEEAADAIAAYLPHRSRPRNLDGLRKNLRRGRDRRYRWHYDPRFVDGPEHRRAMPDDDRVRRAAARIRVPTLLVRGQLSDLVSEDSVRDFLSVVPHGSFVDVSGAAHMVAGDENDAFTDAVVTFLRDAFSPNDRVVAAG